MRITCVLVVALCLACDDSGSDGAPSADGSVQGSLGAPCYGNGTCDEGLRCDADDRCVEADDESDAGDDDGAVSVDVGTADIGGPEADTGAPGEDAGGRDGGAADAGLDCDEANPCPGNQICTGTHECAEPGVCASNEDCLGERECIDGACGSPCMEDADCPGNRACVAGRCPEAEVCAGPDDCDAPRRCVDGGCLDPCAGDGDCDEGEICDEELEVCREGEVPACEEDADCPGNRACIAGECPEPVVCFGPEDCDAPRRCIEAECRVPCAGDGDCDGMLTCDEDSGLCVETGECAVDDDCVGARVCASGECIEPCEGDGVCPGTRMCDPVTRQCAEAMPCFVEEDCDADRACFDGACVDTCVDARPCPGGLECDQANGLCAEPEVCEADEQCRGMRVCSGGVCGPRCEVDDECPGEQVCAVDTGRCQGPEAGCAVDQDCPGRERCGPGGVCFVPDCETNDDCEGACVDQRCAAGPPTACGPGAACPVPQQCAPLGACVLAAACEGDEQCPAAAPRCDAFDGRCAECLGAGDCARAEQCDGGRCVYIGVCEADEDCPGERTCLAGACAAVGPCAGDRFDRDPAAAQLVRRTYTGLVLCDDAEDRFDVAVPAGEGLRVVLRHDPGPGRLELALEEPERGEVLSRSALGHGVEVVGVAPDEAARNLVLRVGGRPGYSVDYALTLERADGCIPDALEGLLGNDDADRATPVEAGQIDLEICPGEQDWLALELPAGVRVSALVEGDPSVEVALLDPEQANVATVNGREELARDIRAPGLYRLRVLARGAMSPQPVRLQLSVFPMEDAEAVACAAPLVLADGVPALTARPPAIRRFGTTCGPDIDGDVLFRFTLEAPAMVDLRARGASALAVRRACADIESEQACAAGDAPALEGLDLGAGEWFVVLKASGAERPQLTLSARSACANDADCGDGVCDGGLCHAPCQADEDCPGNQTCRRGDGHCLEPARCEADADCLGARRCRHDGACFEADCAVNDDCGDGACVDEQCADAPPAECGRDADCDAPQTCNALGACRLDGPCARDGDCPAGSPVCQGGECVVCADDGDCQGGEVCDARRCVFQGVCEGPGDCPGERACEQGLCQPPEGCAGDRFDGLAEPAELVARTHRGLLLCDGALDRYLVSLAPGRGLRVVLRHDPSLGDLSLRLERPPPAFELIAESDGTLGVEVVQAAADAMGGQLELQVQGRAGFATPYSLTVEHVDGGACVPDAFEGLEGNDALADAAPLDAGEHEITLCPDDADWFALDLAVGTALSVRATPTPAVPLTLRIYGPDRQPIADAAEEGGVWSVEAEAAEAGVHRIQVEGPARDEPVEVRLEVSTGAGDDPEQLACRDARALVVGQQLQFAPGQPVLRFAHSCGFGMYDYVARFQLNAAATVSFETSPGTALALRSACANPDSEFFCGFAGDLDGIELEPGEYSVVLQRLEPDPPTLTLRVE